MSKSSNTQWEELPPVPPPTLDQNIRVSRIIDNLARNQDEVDMLTDMLGIEDFEESEQDCPPGYFQNPTLCNRRAELLYLWGKGYTNQELADHFDVSYNTVWRWVRAANLPRRSRQWRSRPYRRPAKQA